MGHRMVQTCAQNQLATVRQQVGHLRPHAFRSRLKILRHRLALLRILRPLVTCQGAENLRVIVLKEIIELHQLLGWSQRLHAFLHIAVRPRQARDIRVRGIPQALVVLISAFLLTIGHAPDLSSLPRRSSGRGTGTGQCSARPTQSERLSAQIHWATPTASGNAGPTTNESEVKTMSVNIKTTHVGSLPRTKELLEVNNKFSAGEIEREDFLDILQESIDKVVAKQHEMGVSIINEGEYGHVTSGAVDYGAWWNYSFSRLGGLTMTDEDRWANQEAIRSEPGNIRLTSFADRRDRALFSEAYEDPASGILTNRASVGNPKITGPITYIGKEQIDTDVQMLTNAMKKTGATEGFVAALSPGSAARLKNEYYETDDDIVWACADAMAEEYRAITDAGLTVSIDDPSLAESWDQINPEP